MVVYMERKINVTIFNEFHHEKTDPVCAEIYPEGIHAAIADFLSQSDAVGLIRVATMDDYRSVLTEETLNDTDVLVWWAHVLHHEVDDEIVERCHKRVLNGMGLVALHSAHASKLFKRLLGTDTDLLRWREAGERVRLWNLAPNHPITQGISETFVVEHDETYGEPFGIPEPDELIFLSWFQGGEVLRSGCTWRRGEGKIFYFQNGHETHPVYYQPEIQTVISNAVRWAAPIKRVCVPDRGGWNTPALENV